MKTYLNVPVHEGFNYGFYHFIYVESIPAKHRDAFMAWMKNDTGLEDPYARKNKRAAYLRDFESWYERTIDPGPDKTFFNIPIRKDNSFSYICIEDIPEEHRDEFDRWMGGQTVSRGEQCGNNVAIYLWDFERWYKMKFKNQPTYFD